MVLIAWHASSDVIYYYYYISVSGLLCIVTFVSLKYQEFVTLQFTMMINKQELKINKNVYVLF